MKKISFLCMQAFFILLLLCQSCEKTTQTSPEEIEISVQRSGKLDLNKKKDFPRTIYIDIRDSTGHVPLTPEYLPRMLAQDNFEVVDNPSKASYILHIFLLEEGRTDPNVLNELVNSGYDGKTGFSGDGLSAWLADALLVQRRVPEAKRESHVRLQNISARNALGNSQMRIAVSSPTILEGRSAFARTFAQTLAQAIREALTEPGKVQTEDRAKKEPPKK